VQKNINAYENFLHHSRSTFFEAQVCFQLKFAFGSQVWSNSFSKCLKIHVFLQLRGPTRSLTRLQAYGTGRGNFDRYVGENDANQSNFSIMQQGAYDGSTYKAPNSAAFPPYQQQANVKGWNAQYPPSFDPYNYNDNYWEQGSAVQSQANQNPYGYGSMIYWKRYYCKSSSREYYFEFLDSCLFLLFFTNFFLIIKTQVLFSFRYTGGLTLEINWLVVPSFIILILRNLLLWSPLMWLIHLYWNIVFIKWRWISNLLWFLYCLF